MIALTVRIAQCPTFLLSAIQPVFSSLQARFQLVFGHPPYSFYRRDLACAHHSNLVRRYTKRYGSPQSEHSICLTLKGPLARSIDGSLLFVSSQTQFESWCIEIGLIAIAEHEGTHTQRRRNKPCPLQCLSVQIRAALTCLFERSIKEPLRSGALTGMVGTACYSDPSSDTK